MRTTLIETNGDAHEVTIASFTRDEDGKHNSECNQFEFVHSDTPDFEVGQIGEIITTNDKGETQVFYVRCLVATSDSSTWQSLADSPDRYEWLADSLGVSV